MTIQEMNERKKELGYTYAQIAELSGVPLGTVQKVLGGATMSPRYDTLQSLTKVFSSPTAKSTPDEAFCIHEGHAGYMPRQQGDYTLEDYYNIPEDTRVELIDGVIYDMTAPSSAHQLIIGGLFTQLFNHVHSKGGSCIPIISPVDVQLDCDDKTMVEPDVIVVCDRDKIIDRCIYGAPDFVVEVLSPSTKRKDAFIKLNKYMDAGVREYWMIDPKQKKVIVYDFAHDNYPILYGFDSMIPVQIWDGEFCVDFNQIYDFIRFLYERETPNTES